MCGRGGIAGRAAAAALLGALSARPAVSQLVLLTPNMGGAVLNPLSQTDNCCGAHIGDGLCADGIAAAGLSRCCGHPNGTCNMLCCDCSHGCRGAADQKVEHDIEVINGTLLDLPLNEFPMIVAHDAGTGYETRHYCNHLNPVGNYAVCQRGSFFEQLECGARVFDLRPYKTEAGELKIHHGGVVFDVEVAEALNDTLRWVEGHPEELVILFISKVSGDTADLKEEIKKDIPALVKEYQIPVLSSSEATMKSMTVKKAMEKGKRGQGGSLLVVYKLGADYYDSSITCYKQSGLTVESCISSLESKRKGRYQAVQDYLDSHLNDPETPLAGGALWNTQAHWQYDEFSVVQGLSKLSCILAEESTSRLNKLVASSIAQDEFKAINLLQVDYVCNGGKELYMAMREFAHRYSVKKFSAAGDTIEEVEMPQGRRAFRPCYTRAFLIVSGYVALVAGLGVVLHRIYGSLRPHKRAGVVASAESDAEASCTDQRLLQ